MARAREKLEGKTLCEIRAKGQMGKWAKGQKGQRAKGPKGQRAKGQKGKRVKGQKGTTAKGQGQIGNINHKHCGKLRKVLLSENRRL